MKKRFLRSVIPAVVVVVCTCFGIVGHQAWADSNSMTVSPPYQKMILIPGETYNGYLTVSNASSSTRNLKYAVQVGSFSQHKGDGSKDDYGSVDHISRSSYNQIMDWIKIDKDSGEIAPGETRDVKYSIEVPESAPAGGQYATILVVDETTSGLPGEGNISIDQKFQFASIIYAEVTGETKENGEILENNMPSFLLNGPLTAESTVKNNGNVHTDAEYVLQVTPFFGGDDFCNNEEKPETSLILPETERYHAQTCDLPAVGIFKAKQTVKIFGETSIVERTVIMCPLWLLFVILFVVILIIGWIFFRFKSKGRSRRD